MKKKILFLVNSLSFFISHRLEIAIAAKNQGYEVCVGYGELGNTDTAMLSKIGIDFIRFPLERISINPFKEIRSLFSIWRIFSKFKPDIVHLITVKVYLYGGICARLTRVPSVVSAISGLGILFNQRNLTNFIFQKTLYLSFVFAMNHPNQKVIVQNLEDKKTLVNWGVINQKKNCVVSWFGC